MRRADVAALDAAFDDHVRHELRKAETEMLVADLDVDVIDRTLANVAVFARRLHRQALARCRDLDRRTRLATVEALC